MIVNCVIFLELDANDNRIENAIRLESGRPSSFPCYKKGETIHLFSKVLESKPVSGKYEIVEIQHMFQIEKLNKIEVVETYSMEVYVKPITKN